MLYLVTPNNSKLSWTSFPGAFLDDIGKHPDVDLGKLSWQESEVLLTGDAVMLALSKGLPTAAGIVVEAMDLQTLTYAESLRAIRNQGAANSANAQPTFDALNKFMEPQAPGWTAEADRVNAAADASVQESIDRAEADANTFKLTLAPESALVEHWQELGGSVPEINPRDEELEE